MPRDKSAEASHLSEGSVTEHFQWLTGEQAAASVRDEKQRAAVAEELADVIIYALSLANALEIDVSEAVLGKLERNEQRFPADEWRGRA